MIKSVLYTIFVLFFLTSCHGPMIGQSQDVIIVDCIRKDNNFHLAKSGLVRVGLGDAYNPEKKTLKESYQTRKMRFQQIEEARQFFVKVFNDYIQPFNADKRLNCTFSPLNTELEITFLGELGVPLTAPLVARIRNEQTRVVFYSFNPVEQRYIQLTQEPF